MSTTMVVRGLATKIKTTEKWWSPAGARSIAHYCWTRFQIRVLDRGAIRDHARVIEGSGLYQFGSAWDTEDRRRAFEKMAAAHQEHDQLAE